MTEGKNNKLHYIRINGYTKQIEAIFNKYNKQFAELGLSVDYDKKQGLFYFSDYPEIKTKADKLLKDFVKELSNYIKVACDKEWDKANTDDNALVQQFLGNIWRRKEFEKYLQGNQAAKESFLKRRSKGLNLSQK